MQEDVQLRRKGESFEIVGIVNLGDIYDDIQVLQTGMHKYFRLPIYRVLK
jgi:hypothetical protein